jgi:UDP-galactopyranose mutase
MRVFDYVIVGAGFAGSVMAERLASDGGKSVLLVDRRNHVGGNAYDYYDDAGVLVHKYGPHVFHTNSERVFRYLSRFTTWRPYVHRVLAHVDGRLLPFPINLDTVNALYGTALNESELEAYFASVAEPVSAIRNSEQAIVSRVGRDLYEKFFRHYTKKQWGCEAAELDASVIARIPVRTDRDDRYFTDRYQVMPSNGYTAMFTRMLSHSNIVTVLNADFRDVRRAVRYDNVIYTGAIDEYFDQRYGQLPYRSLKFVHRTLPQPVFQPVAVVNYPQDRDYTRVTEYKHLTGQHHAMTSITYEYPQDAREPYYPVPRAENAQLYKRYRELAAMTANVHFVGRLATYQYYNMDQVVAQALCTYAKISEAHDEAKAV